MKIFAIARNYADHAKEMNHPVREDPVVFIKPPTALLRENNPFYYPDFSSNIHYETEIVLRVCKNGKHIEEKIASTHFDAITLGIDFTARDLQQQCKEKGLPWEIAKGFDKSAAIGPQLIPVEEIGDLNNIAFSLTMNGKKVQEGNTKDVLFSFDRIISYLSKFFTLNMGDYIFTGTPYGVGSVKIGDKLEGYIGEKKMLECEIK